MRIQGNVSFELTGADGSTVQLWPESPLLKGRHIKQLGAPAVKPGLYYLHVYVNGAWAHMQEWEVK
jgi:hypothetical protein